MDAEVLRLADRALDISFRKGLSHLGSVLSTLPIIWEIYRDIKEEDRFVLSNGHAGLALYVILEKIYGLDAETLVDTYGIHPVRSPHIDCSTGSLGIGIAIAAGISLASKGRVSCIISDGECAEGLVWESLRFIEDSCSGNIVVYIDMNGLSAYDTVNTNKLEKRLRAFHPVIQIRETPLKQYSFVNGLNYHYKILNEREYQTMKERGIYA